MIDLDMFGRDIKNMGDELSKIQDMYSVELTVTSNCNFKCSYCCEGDACDVDSTFDDVDSLFEMIDGLLVDDWFLSVFSGVSIGFWGGEPTLKPSIIRKVVEKYKDNHLIHFFIYTVASGATAL